ncbi:hypothetical protein [Streptomyces caniferus]|uniref:hypothetical protein n=1 Tax=Streptomyces caniferus TaxID=285557 RepID=UPI00383040A7
MDDVATDDVATDDAALLEALLSSLAGDENVYSRWCWSAGSDLAHHVHDLAKAAEADWAHEAVRGCHRTDHAQNGRAWNPVTRHTFDGVVAGRGGGFVVSLLQVGED